MLDIKKVTVDNITEVALLFDAYRIFYGQLSNLPASFDFLLQRTSNGESVIFMAVLNGEAVGFVQLYPVYSSVHLKKSWLLNDLFVAAQARERGIGEALLQQAKHFGRESGAAYLFLQTAADNYRSQSIYEKNGWIRSQDYFYEFLLE